eukprot:m.186917 g.186917  ORF g.186917 m.186917 type:complete len:111 (+) comp24778_c0_seq7:369-701(+)
MNTHFQTLLHLCLLMHKLHLCHPFFTTLCASSSGGVFNSHLCTVPPPLQIVILLLSSHTVKAGTGTTGALMCTTATNKSRCPTYLCVFLVLVIGIHQDQSRQCTASTRFR